VCVCVCGWVWVCVCCNRLISALVGDIDIDSVCVCVADGVVLKL